jgi:hypothetical protein
MGGKRLIRTKGRRFRFVPVSTTNSNKKRKEKSSCFFFFVLFSTNANEATKADILLSKGILFFCSEILFNDGARRTNVKASAS